MSVARLTEIEINKIKIYSNDSTGSAAISTSITTPVTGLQWKFKELRISLDAVGQSGALTITINDATGAAYDHVLLTQDMTAVQYLRYVPDGEVILQPTDTIDIAWANANTHTYGLVVETQQWN